MKQKDESVVSELTATNAGIAEDMSIKLNLEEGLCGEAFKSRQILVEPFAQSSSIISKQESDAQLLGVTVHNLIAAPIFGPDERSIGVFELYNCDKSLLANLPRCISVLGKFAKYISLLFYTNMLLKVPCTNHPY
ncbi:MAG: GAF domain-containing protein [Candidatus Pacebacteria bacterium]|nr:GAF domain-containing protein [Candidatus Paceibacterota bacterium]